MSNRFLKEFRKRASDHFTADSSKMSYSEWISLNTTLNKVPFSFKGYEFQRQLCDDMHEDLSIIKISQVGATELQLRKALAILLRNKGTSLIFSLPTEDMYKKISKARIRPMVMADKVFNSPEDVVNKAIRSTELMQFGNSFLYIVPAIETAATSINADFVFNDEVDLSDQKMISLFSSRLQGSNYRVSQKFSTPTFPSYGIDNNWQSSDQHEYLCKCNSCGHWNNPKFNRDFINLPGLPDIGNLTDISITYQDQLDFSNSYVKCEKCDSPLDLDNVDNRAWIPTYPSRISRGYRISPFVNSRLNVKYIFKSLWSYQKNEFLRGFHNTVLGEPFSDGTMQIPVEDIIRSMTLGEAYPELENLSNLWVGIDVGQTCHVVIGQGTEFENIRAIKFYQIKIDELKEHVEHLCSTYHIIGGAIDRHPYEPNSREVFHTTQGKIVPCEYRGDKDINIVKDQFGELSHVQANHTWFLDNVATRFRRGTIEIGGYGFSGRNNLISHLRDMVRSDEPDKPSTWKKLNGEDHFFHALGFMLSAMKIRDVHLYKNSTYIPTMLTTAIENFGSEDLDDYGRLLGVKRLD